MDAVTLRELLALENGWGSGDGYGDGEGYVDG